MDDVKALLLGAAKAFVAAVVPIVVAILVELVTDLGGLVLPAVLAGAVTGASVYRVPNRVT